MKAGDVVKIWKVSHWGGITPTEKRGILINRTVLAYESKNSYWKVLISGKIQIMRERQLQRMYK